MLQWDRGVNKKYNQILYNMLESNEQYGDN